MGKTKDEMTTEIIYNQQKKIEDLEGDLRSAHKDILSLQNNNKYLYDRIQNLSDEIDKLTVKAPEE